MSVQDSFFRKGVKDGSMLMLEGTFKVIGLSGEESAAHFDHVGLCSKGG